MSFQFLIESAVIKSLAELYGLNASNKDFQINETKTEFSGDYTIVLFALVKNLKKSPEALGQQLGEHLLLTNEHLFASFNVIKGFLNLVLADAPLLHILESNYQNIHFGKKPATHKKVMVEYSSPNTNKPLHLGHLRNNFLGWSVAEILKANGHEVIKTAVVNDRGIHICKSMLAWELYANGATPESANEKGDHFVGDYYVKFNDEYLQEIATLKDTGMAEEVAKKEAPIMKKTQQMLLDWEEGNKEVRALWQKMNGWVYDGFEKTYKKIGSDFDHTFYESETYLLGKDFVKEGLQKNILYKKDDGSVWIDLTAEGLDEKLVLRADGTSVYITQDIGLAKEKFENYHLDQSIYVIGDEQLYHMKVLKEILRKLGLPFADEVHHLSYGMVELTSGKMKSREGTVVDADDLIQEMETTAAQHTMELGKVNDFTPQELNKLYETLALGAMKFYLLRVDPKKRMVFNPEESIDFHGYTGPFVQYTYARVQSIMRKLQSKSTFNAEEENKPTTYREALLPLERQLIIYLEKYGNIIEEAGKEMNPSAVANYVFHLAKLFNSFYAEHSVANAETNEKQQLRIRLSLMSSLVIKSGLQLLGIGVPERM
ncbi:MAG: arginine--tRNA ligase [Bacteroidetes bacterium]|nr:arginine--tRNA ligase [Bacteroidota bacterium]